jgi:hypothetical protein
MKFAVLWGVMSCNLVDKCTSVWIWTVLAKLIINFMIMLAAQAAHMQKLLQKYKNI